MREFLKLKALEPKPSRPPVLIGVFSPRFIKGNLSISDGFCKLYEISPKVLLESKDGRDID